jgi:hypothetical protein
MWGSEIIAKHLVAIDAPITPPPGYPLRLKPKLAANEGPTTFNQSTSAPVFPQNVSPGQSVFIPWGNSGARARTKAGLIGSQINLPIPSSIWMRLHQKQSLLSRDSELRAWVREMNIVQSFFWHPPDTQHSVEFGTGIL